MALQIQDSGENVGQFLNTTLEQVSQNSNGQAANYIINKALEEQPIPPQQPQAPMSNESTPTGDSFLVYSNPTYGFSIEYPHNWKALEGNRLPGSHIEEIETIVAFVPPGEIATSSGYTAFVEVAAYHPAEDPDLDNKDIDLDEMLGENTRHITKDRSLTNLILEKSNADGLLSGHPAYVMSYSVDRKNVQVTSPIIVNEIGTKVFDDYYIIDYISHKVTA